MHEFSNSGMLKCCEHDEANSMMIITFKNGQRYKYHGVPRDVYHKLIKAESAGRHFGEFIKGNYEHYKMPED